MIRVAASASSSEAYQMATEHFEAEIGDAVVFETKPVVLMLDPVTGLDPQFDRSGLNELKAMLET